LNLQEAVAKAKKEWEDDPAKSKEEKEVIGKYGKLFHPDNIGNLTAEDYKSFLRFDNNKHWSNLERSGYGLVSDIDKFKKTVKILLDENIPIEERLKRIRDKQSPDYLSGFGPAYYTPILLMVYPDKYPVINGIVISALEDTGLYKKYKSKPEWIAYPEARKIILDVARQNNLSLWEIDWTWWNMVKRGKREFPIALCWTTDDPDKVELFQQIISQKGNAYYGVNWSSSRLREDDYPMTVYLNHKRNIIAKGKITRIIPDEEFQLLADKNEYLIPQIHSVGENWKNYIEFIKLDKINPFPQKRLKLYFYDDREIPDNLRNKIYVVDMDYETEDNISYWKVSPGPRAENWEDFKNAGIIAIGWNKIGDISQKTSDEIEKIFEEKYPNELDTSIQRFMKIKPGDIIFANKGLESIVGIGKVLATYRYDPSNIYHHILDVEWFDTKEKKIPGGRAGWLKTVISIPKEEALKYLSREDPEIENIIKKLQQNKQIVLYGPPGTGKTHTAKKVAVSLLTNSTVNDEDVGKLFERLQEQEKVKIVQFHPSYSYEDFVQGIKPTTKNGNISYEIRDGIFKKLCDQKANGSEYFAKIESYEEIKKPFRAEEISIQLEQYGINKIEQGRFEFIRDVIRTNLQEIDFLNSKHKFNDFFVLRTLSEDNPYGDVTGEQYHFSKGIPGSKQLLDALNTNSVPFFYYDVNKGGFFGAGILNGITSRDSSPRILIIDEINRGNLSKIFGELIYALEYRNEKIDLQYAEFDNDPENDSLIVPDNLLIIATMNTADRSISLFDTAMRRRFAFVPMMPDYDVVLQAIGLDVKFDEEKLKGVYGTLSKHQNKVILSTLAVHKINEKIINDIRMGREKQIGHTYLLKIAKNEDDFLNVWKHQIIPLLEEFYSSKYDELTKIIGDKIIDKQRGIKDFDEVELEELLNSIIST